MWIECIGPGFTYRWPQGAVHLTPGHPIELEDIRALKLIAKAPGRVRAVETPLSIHSGDQIAWPRGGIEQFGLVEFIHVDDAGVAWAFVTEGTSWAAVNLKYARVMSSS